MSSSAARGMFSALTVVVEEKRKVVKESIACKWSGGRGRD